MAHRSYTGTRNSFQATSIRLSHWAFEDSLSESWSTPSTVLPARDSVSAAATIVAQDTLAYTAEGTAASAANTIFDLFNSAGTSTFRQPAVLNTGTMVDTPAVGDSVLEFATTTRVLKDNNSLPGTTNGGAPLRQWYVRFYVYLVGLPTVSATRLLVVEQSAANGGADIHTIRTGTTGTFSIGDGATYTGNSTRVGTSDWTRVEIFADQRAHAQECRLFWGSNLHGPASQPNETLTNTLLTAGDPEVWGIGMYLGPSSSPIYFSAPAIGYGTWLGPVPGGRLHTGASAAGFGGMIKPYETVAA